MTMNLQVGQQVLSVERGFYTKSPRITQVVITKIGRKWAEYARGRFNRYTGEIDGHGFASPGKCYYNEAHWRAEEEADAAWKWFKQATPWPRPIGVSAETILAAARMVGIECSPQAKNMGKVA